MDNTGQHIVRIINETWCQRHGASQNEPCWTIYANTTRSVTNAVCGQRVKTMGYDGFISDSSLSLSKPTHVRK